MDGAVSLWELCDDSTASLFGDGIDDPIADRIRNGGRNALVSYPADPEWTKHGRPRG
jgi:hypothetical protein